MVRIHEVEHFLDVLLAHVVALVGVTVPYLLDAQLAIVIFIKLLENLRQAVLLFFCQKLGSDERKRSNFQGLVRALGSRR